MQAWGLTDPGMIRPQNQDDYSIVKLGRDQLLAIVCDGMGGARAGNIASSMAVEIFMNRFLHATGEWRERMQQAASEANRQVFQKAITDEAYTGMGTTIVSAFVGIEEALILNEGDSCLCLGGEKHSIANRMSECNVEVFAVILTY